MRSSRRTIASIVGITLAALLGCAAPPAEEAALAEADAAVERARSAPRVRALAAAELDRAEVTLQRAREAVAAGAPASHVSHLAYAASRQAALAESQAADRVAQAELESLQRALDQLLADAPADRRRPDRAGGDALLAASTARVPDLILSLAELPFREAEPGDGAASRLDEVARLLRDSPARGLAIEVDFDLPDAAARTLMERRIEAVRTAFEDRGIDPFRIRVRAAAPDGERAVTSIERFEP
jgi:multidrug efflux pump subunit AcrA (membrane-fusion protein)